MSGEAIALNVTNKINILVIDLTKAIDCTVHDFLIAKLEAYGFLKIKKLFNVKIVF